MAHSYLLYIFSLKTGGYSHTFLPLNNKNDILKVIEHHVLNFSPSFLFG